MYETQDKMVVVWHELFVDEYLVIRLDAFFNQSRQWGIIEVMVPGYGVSMVTGNTFSDDYRLDLIAVPSGDYRDTITKAQMVWESTLEEYRQKALDLKSKKD